MKIAESGKPRDKVADGRSLYSVLNLLVWRGLLAGRVYSTKSFDRGLDASGVTGLNSLRKDPRRAIPKRAARRGIFVGFPIGASSIVSDGIIHQRGTLATFSACFFVN